MPYVPSGGDTALTLPQRRCGFWAIELLLVGVFLCLHLGVGVWDWWRNGDRVTGLVLNAHHVDEGADTLTILEPATERTIKVSPGPFDREKQVGDTATAVVRRGHPNLVATPADLNFYLAVWAVLALLIAVWPVRCWRRYRTLVTGDFAEFRAAVNEP